MKPVLIAFASGSERLIPEFLNRLEAAAPGVELWVVSEFPPPRGRWIPYHVGRSLRHNLARLRAAIGEAPIHLAGAILEPNVPFRRMRLMALRLAPLRTLFFNENLDHFMLRPRSAAAIAGHFLWRAGNLARYQLRPGGGVYTFLWRLAHPKALARPFFYRRALFTGWRLYWMKRFSPARPDGAPGPLLPAGVSVVIPSRNGIDLLDRLLPSLLRQLGGIESEVIVSDNGSTDRTALHLRSQYPQTLVLESSSPLSFARAVNTGIGSARFSHVLLLNNDMELREGFFAPLLDAFRRDANLFCATAQIFFPEGARREETGKAVMPALPARTGTDFTLTCLEPIQGEDGTYVLYGSGGCSLYDTVKLRALGCLREFYSPAYVEDLDLGFRAWQRGWPTVFVAGAQVIHRHRTTTSRYYSEEQLGLALELNYLRFLGHAIADAALFRTLWRDAVLRLNLLAIAGKRYARDAMRMSAAALLSSPRPAGGFTDREALALGSGETAVFPGMRPRGFPVAVIVSPYVPFPLSHGGAVRMFHLMREAAADFDLVLVTFVDQLAKPPDELLSFCCETVEVRRSGRHSNPLTDRPDTVEDFDRLAFHAVLRQTVRKWNARIVQLEFTQMAQYAPDCRPARTILVEHDITLDLYEQLLRDKPGDWETEQQLERWRKFETDAWRDVDCVVTMSGKDRRRVDAPMAIAIPNGVDLARFTPGSEEPAPARLLFLGSFAHLPNVLAVDFFLREVWPLLGPETTLHVIAGRDPEFFLDRYKDRAAPPLDQARVELEAFVSDVRPAYRRATLAIAPLPASAGTNIKILEAMAMGKAIVTTPAGVNGLDELARGRDAAVAHTAGEMAAVIQQLLADPERRRSMERHARLAAERHFGWDAIGKAQTRLYRKLLGGPDLP